jgi:hypothetical protein
VRIGRRVRQEPKEPEPTVPFVAGVTELAPANPGIDYNGAIGVGPSDHLGGDGIVGDGARFLK